MHKIYIKLNIYLKEIFAMKKANINKRMIGITIPIFCLLIGLLTSGPGAQAEVGGEGYFSRRVIIGPAGEYQLILSADVVSPLADTGMYWGVEDISAPHIESVEDYSLPSGPTGYPGIYITGSDQGSGDYGYLEVQAKNSRFRGDLTIGGNGITTQLCLNDEACISDWDELPGVGEGIGGGGNPGYLPVFTATDAIGNSEIYQTETNIGIGTTSSSNAKVDIRNAPDWGGAGWGKALRIDSIDAIQIDAGASQYGIGGSGGTQLLYIMPFDGEGPGAGNAYSGIHMNWDGDVSIGSPAAEFWQEKLNVAGGLNVTSWIADRGVGQDLNIDDNMTPRINSSYYLGASGNKWLQVHSDQYCLPGNDCISSWPTGSSYIFTSPIEESGGTVYLTDTCTATEILKWNGSAWACADDASGSPLWTDGGTYVYPTDAGAYGVSGLSIEDTGN
ncbi:MAG: hypothetical protein ABIB97_04160, partial [Patescibacteria group bacterium]